MVKYSLAQRYQSELVEDLPQRLVKHVPMTLFALGIEEDTGLALKACRRMNGKPGPQGNAQLY